MSFAESLGIVIRLHRNKKGLSQTDLSAASDKERGFISDVENGKRNISMNTFFQLCKGLDIDPRIILDEALKRMGK